jgi:hypothetical protein
MILTKRKKNIASTVPVGDPIIQKSSRLKRKVSSHLQRHISLRGSLELESLTVSLEDPGFKY